MKHEDFIVSMKGIQKSFGGVHALTDGELTLRKGEVLGLIGENGAGKSTLMKILSGVYQADAGVMMVDGKEVHYHEPRQALHDGICMIYQELNLVQHLSVGDNIFIGRESKKGWKLDRTKDNGRAEELLKELELDVSPNTIVNTLTVAKQQMIEIAKGISYDSKVLIMSTLLIGGNGLIGTRLSAYLADHGEEVFSYSLHSPSQKHPGVHYIQGDVTDYGTLNMLLKQNHIDRIIHNAGVSHPKMFRDNPYKIYRTNVNGVLTSLEAARNYGVDRYVYISSGAVYGNVHYDVVDETIPLHAENPYGATKVACEELVRNYGLDSVSLRVGFVYGPGRVNECPVNMILSTLLKEGKVDWDHGSEQMLDFIYIEDCVEAIAKISLADHNPHAEYNIGGGEVIPYTRIIDKARKLFPTAPIHVGPGDLGYDNLGALSVQRAFEDFGWKPRFSIEQGMEQYMNWLKNF